MIPPIYLISQLTKETSANKLSLPISNGPAGLEIMLQKKTTHFAHMTKSKTKKKKNKNYFYFYESTTMATYPIEKRKHLLIFSNHTCPSNFSQIPLFPFGVPFRLLILTTTQQPSYFFQHYCQPFSLFCIKIWFFLSGLVVFLRYLFDLAGGFWLLYLKMKRASVNLQECNGVDEEANRARLKHQALLREYLQLQKVRLF